MSTHRARFRAPLLCTAALALIAPVALAVGLAGAPASASATPKSHDVDTYKVEGRVDLDGEFPDNAAHEHLYCHPGDYALDGMWKVDAYDTPNPDSGVYGDMRDVRVDASYADPTDVTKWHFRFANLGTGRAQIKTFVTCLVTHTGERRGHTHNLALTRHSAAVAPVSAGSPAVEYPVPCAADEVAVAPGFNFSTGSSGRIYRSYPSDDFRGWLWAFQADHATDDLTVYLTCLSDETSANGSPNHRHPLDLVWVPGWSGSWDTAPSAGDSMRSLRANPHDDAVVGAFWIDDPTHVSYLGMDARGRMRGYKFWWDGIGSSWTKIAVLGMGHRTGPQIAP